MSIRRNALLAAIGLTSALALTISGCAGTGGTEAPASSGQGDIPSDTEGTVRILMESVPDTDIVVDLVDSFNEEYPGIAVEIETLGFDQMRDKLIASFQSSEPTYDLIVVDNPWMDDFVDAGFLQPLDDRITTTTDYAAEDFFQPLVDITEVDGVRYGVPFYNYALGYLYRTDLYEEAGLSVPSTLDELVANSQALTTSERTGIAMQPQRGYKIFEEWANWLFAAGGSIYDESGAPTLNTPEAQAALEAYIEAFTTAAPANSSNWAFDEAFRSVSGDQSAAMISYNWNLPGLNDPEGASGDLAGSFALAPMPGGKQVLGSWSWAIPANSAASDAAWAFAAWITSTEVDVERVVAGGAAIRESTLTDPTVLESGFGEDYYAAIIEILSDAAPLSQGLGGEEMIQAVGTELSEAVAGTKTVEQALADAQAAVERIQR
ncbi:MULTISPECIES: sugar ABC transporter substrate-binding protein [Microcella]|jgi:ABC-type glycerol-3-phosphate transport system substrate-binding protein|uniref:Sugar ABC transporter substrate-binding protein n=1 Tax=Microcella pacifica TaxID=2591847 RepID=A0A9E5JP81_9MICO|nr:MULTISPECIES: sugar ABC transporter substrate-binding protein [Microcella]MBR21223.1 ABC transporter substrate-binding protein [Leifsonia sp.]NHF62362.1 sugar ABC transporter substrate-binding protein [Microcella pacifica]QOD94572.1 sugar ABC transporter substrate-binding protein [Chryseoglobus sp. 28M-23]